jgi:TPR repeat protein
MRNTMRPSGRSRVGVLAVIAIALLSANASAAPEDDYDAGVTLYLKKDYAGAIAMWRAAAGDGHAKAMNVLGTMYTHGRGVKQNDGEALGWYRKATEVGNAQAMLNLGFAYKTGRGVKEDPGDSFQWYRKAAEAGNAKAMLIVGDRYAKGQGVKQDDEEAFRWYRKAAEADNAKAMVSVGNHYAEGRGVKQDKGAALQWYHKAADAGHVMAMNHVGHRYYDGTGVGRHVKAALEAYLKRLEVSPNDTAAMRAYLCRRELGEKDQATAELKKYRAAHKPAAWPDKILAFLIGEIPDTKLLELAASDNETKQRGQQCAAHFYIGVVKHLDSDKATAIKHLKQCIATGATDHPAYQSAQSHLRRLDETKNPD